MSIQRLSSAAAEGSPLERRVSPLSDLRACFERSRIGLWQVSCTREASIHIRVLCDAEGRRERLRWIASSRALAC